MVRVAHALQRNTGEQICAVAHLSLLQFARTGSVGYVHWKDTSNIPFLKVAFANAIGLMLPMLCWLVHFMM